jgi:WD40 repeat protein
MNRLQWLPARTLATIARRGLVVLALAALLWVRFFSLPKAARPAASLPVGLSVDHFTWSPDGSSLACSGHGWKGGSSWMAPAAVASGTGTVEIWDTGRQVITGALPGLGRIISGLAYRDRGRELVVAGRDHATVWRLKPGSAPVRLVAAGGLPRVLALSLDGTSIACGDALEPRVFDMRTGRPAARLRSAALSSIAPMDAVYSPDARFLAVTGYSGLTLWNVSSGEIRRCIPAGDFRGGVSVVNGGTALAAGRTGGRVLFWDQEHGDVPLTRIVSDGLIRCLTFSPDGTHLAVAAEHDRSRGLWVELLIWDRRTQRVISRKRADGTSIASLKYSPDGTKLAVGCEDGTVEIWPVR